MKARFSIKLHGGGCKGGDGVSESGGGGYGDGGGGDTLVLTGLSRPHTLNSFASNSALTR